MNCKTCGTKMVEMILSSFCPNCENAKVPSPPKSIFLTGSSGGTADDGFDLQDGVDICRRIEDVVEVMGWHIGLTGGTLYKSGHRKDIDVIVYPHRYSRHHKVPNANCDSTAAEIAKIFSTSWTRGHYCYNDDKRIYRLGNNIDLFFMCVED